MIFVRQQIPCTHYSFHSHITHSISIVLLWKDGMVQLSRGYWLKLVSICRQQGVCWHGEQINIWYCLFSVILSTTGKVSTFSDHQWVAISARYYIWRGGVLDSTLLNFSEIDWSGFSPQVWHISNVCFCCVCLQYIEIWLNKWLEDNCPCIFLNH